MSNVFIKERRLELNLTLEDVGKAVGVSKSTVKKWEDGQISNMRRDKIELLANILRISPLVILGVNEETETIQIPTREYSFYPEPISAGMPESTEAYTELPKIRIADVILGKYAGRKDLVIMKINGESMNKIIPNNSSIAVLINIDITKLKNGDIVLFSYNKEYAVKRFYDLGKRIKFSPESTDESFADLVLNKGAKVTIIGKVVMYCVGLE